MMDTALTRSQDRADCSAHLGTVSWGSILRGQTHAFVLPPICVAAPSPLLLVSLLYLDFNRTTPLAPSVLEAMEPYWATHFMLPGQQHAHAHAVVEGLEGARENLAAMAGCESFEIVFTGGGTEANNLAILGLVARRRSGARVA